MRKFYKLTRISLNEYNIGPGYGTVMLPINFDRPIFNLGLFSSKKRAQDRLAEIEPRLSINGRLFSPLFNYNTGEGRSECYFSDSISGSIKVVYMITEIETE